MTHKAHSLHESDGEAVYIPEDAEPHLSRESLSALLSSSHTEPEGGIEPHFGGCPVCRVFPCRCSDVNIVSKTDLRWAEWMLSRPLPGYPVGDSFTNTAETFSHQLWESWNNVTRDV